MDDVEPIDHGELNGFYNTVNASKAESTRKDYRARIARLRKLLKLEANDLISDVAATDICKVIYTDSRHANGNLKTKSTPEKYRNALMDYYKKRKITPPVEIEVDLQSFIKGRMSEVATARLNGEMKATEGKDILQYSTYRAIAEASMADNYADGHLFFLFLWNMSCRGDTTHNLHYSCLQWMHDGIMVTIPKSKNHQLGADRGEEHQFMIYANPLDPEVCILLAVGLKVLTCSMVRANAPLYRETEKDHFAAWLQKQVELQEAEQKELLNY